MGSPPSAPAEDANQDNSSPIKPDLLRKHAILMQERLGLILDSVQDIKQKSLRLQTENKFIQEYIESLMKSQR